MSERSSQPPPRRVHLGSHATIVSQAQVYLGQEGLEIDEHTGFASGQRTRVLFDEVQLVTLDRRRSKAGIWISVGGIAFVALACALVAYAPSEKRSEDPYAIFALTTAIVSAPFWLYLVVHLILGADYVTVFGKRSTAKMSFNFQKRRAREVFALIRDRIQLAQQAKSASPAGSGEARAP